VEKLAFLSHFWAFFRAKVSIFEAFFEKNEHFFRHFKAFLKPKMRIFESFLSRF